MEMGVIVQEVFINPGAKQYWLGHQDPSDISVLDRPHAAQAQSDWGRQNQTSSTVNESSARPKSPVLSEFTLQRNVHQALGLSVPHTAMLV